MNYDQLDALVQRIVPSAELYTSTILGDSRYTILAGRVSHEQLGALITAGLSFDFSLTDNRLIMTVRRPK